MERHQQRMIQVLGTASSSGKTLVTMALCRHFSDLGYKVAPFKSMNMSLNSISLPDGSEISRSIWLQALAARTAPDYHMNPFLLKPEGNGKSQLIQNGVSRGIFSVAEYHKLALDRALEVIKDDLEYLFRHYDIVVAEGAGSPAEINLMDRDFANIAVSEVWQTAAILVGSIENGGLFASLYGTIKLMRSSHLVHWIVVNMMRGDASLLDPGLREIETLTGKKVIGVVPYIGNPGLPGEDSLDYRVSSVRKDAEVAVIRYPHMENYSEVDPFLLRGIDFTYVDSSNKDALEQARIILLPGSKRVDEDLHYIIAEGIGERIIQASERGAKIFGVCGGYQMLGERIEFQGHQDYGDSSMDGLGLLDVRTIYEKNKKTGSVKGTFLEGACGISGDVEGYEIHYGTILRGNVNPLLFTGSEREGAITEDRRIIGTNVHGLLENTAFLKFILGEESGDFDYRKRIEENIDRATREIVQNLRLEEIYQYLNIRTSTERD